MGRKKKSEKDVYTGGYISSSRSDPELLKRLYIDEFEPESIDVTTLEDDHRRIIHTPLGSTITSNPYYAPHTNVILPDGPYWYGSSAVTGNWTDTYSSTTILPPEELEALRRKEEELKLKELEKEIGNVKIDKIMSSKKGEHIMACQNKDDLSVENILTTLSAVKGKLMFEIQAFRIKEIECSVTPIVRDHIIKASKKLKSYGKEAPIVACFDEYGKRLPDQLEIGNTTGITLKIVDPEDYGEYYYELKAIELPNTEYTTQREYTYDAFDWRTLPF